MAKNIDLLKLFRSRILLVVSLFLLIIFLVLFFFNPLVSSIPGINYFYKFNYSGVNFVVKEEFDEKLDGPKTVLFLSTKEDFPCYNYHLPVFKYKIRDTIEVNLGNPIHPGDCLAAFGPATNEQKLDLPTGIYTLNLRMLGRTDTYRVEISDQFLKVTPTTDSKFSRNPVPNVKRVPPNLIWATCFFNSNPIGRADFDPCLGFFAELETMATKMPELETGTTKDSNKFYLYQGDTEKLFELVKKNNTRNFYMKIGTWKGESFYCNQLNDCSKSQGYPPKELNPDFFHPNGLRL